MRAWLSSLAAALLLGCEKPKPPAPAPPPVPAQAEQLTEQDTQAHGGALTGPGWRLPLDDRWLEVKAAARQRFKPGTLGWAADPVGPLHVTVECVPAKDGALETSLRTQLALGREQQGLEAVALGKAPDGPWLEGAIAQWAVGDMAHALGRYRLVSSLCDVHVWGPRAQGQPLVERLRATVLAFSGTKPTLLAELKQMAAWFSTHGRADAGVTWVQEATADALKRAPAPLLVERFTLRLQLLETVDTKACAAVVRHERMEPPDLLDGLPEDLAVRWLKVTRQALELAQTPRAGPPLPKEDELRTALLALSLRDEELGGAMNTLKRADIAPDPVVCEAEKLRLKKLLAQPAAERAVLLRALL